MSCTSCWPPASVSSSIQGLDEDEAEDREHQESETGPSQKTESRIPDGGSFDLTELHEALDNTAATGLQSPVGSTSKGFSKQAEGKDVENSASDSYQTQADDGGCVSCSISLPDGTISQLPLWAPGSPKKGGVGRNGSPVMRTTEKVFGHWNQESGIDAEEAPNFQQSSPDSFVSSTSRSSCHPHELIYRTTSSPIDPNTYSILRRATIRTLSCEQLPRGLTSGAISFGDPVDGYTVAYKFRLPDPYARGCQRHYALLALAGQDPARVYKATPIIWKAFRRIATSIMSKAESTISQSQASDDMRGGRKQVMPISSFLTGRTVDPDGYPRRNGGSGTRARGLAEMVGDELIFAHLHGEFTYLLQSLGRQLGGIRPRYANDEDDRNEGFHDARTTGSYPPMVDPEVEKL